VESQRVASPEFNFVLATANEAPVRSFSLPAEVFVPLPRAFPTQRGLVTAE
jgi:hypothetical protein